MALTDIDGQRLGDSVAPKLSNRNKIINGAMQVWQRGTSFSSAASGGGRYTADRWNVPNRTRAARSTDAPTGFTYSLLIDREQTGGTEPFTVSTGIEVQDITQTGSYTLSFYAKSADITTLNINVQDRTNVGEGGTNNSSIVTDKAITIDNTWTRYTYTFTISSVTFTGTSLRVSIGNTSAAQDDEALITGVQLEVGNTATPFEHRSYGDELARCQRYYYRHNVTSNLTGGWGGMYTSNGGRVFNAFPVTMRATPTLIVEDFSYDRIGSGGTTATSNTNGNISVSGATWDGTGFNFTGTFGQPLAYTGRWNVNAEL